MESKRLAGKTAVVTAAASGIGRASAEAFARAGARVIAADIDAKALQTLAGCEAHVLDVRDAGAIEAFAKSAGKVDVLFNCAGTVPKGTVLDLDPATWNAAFDLNVNSMFHMIRAFLPAMLTARAGSIINMSSVAGSITGVPDRCAYGATKAAVIGLTKSVAADFVAQGIRCNAISPARVHTPFVDGFLAKNYPGNEKEMFDKLSRTQPIGRMGQPAEIAELALFLCSDAASFITGSNYVIDGGLIKTT